MPTYDYQCRSCGSVTEVIHSMLEEGPTACERCGGDLRRVLHATGIIFKGSGFYRTDSRKSETSAVPASGKSSSKEPAAPAGSTSEPAGGTTKGGAGTTKSDSGTGD